MSEASVKTAKSAKLAKTIKRVSSAKAPITAWQPLTLGGVAAYAHASPVRLLVTQCVVAVLSACCVLWFIQTQYLPVIQRAISILPEKGEIRSGQLLWKGDPVKPLGESPFLAVIVDMQDTGRLGQIADLQCELRKNGLALNSIGGRLEIPYPLGWVIAVNRNDLGPLLGAWRPMILATTGISMSAFFLVLWSVLAGLYAPFIRVWTFLIGKQVTFGGCWRLASAALMPGAVVMSAAIVLYGLHGLDLVGLLAAFGLHLIVGGIYVFLGTFKLPGSR